MTCLSNMSVLSTALLENGMQEVTFLKTPIMATYVSALGDGGRLPFVVDDLAQYVINAPSVYTLSYWPG